MAAPQQQGKILRIGIIQGGKITEERLIGRGETVTIGEASKNTFVLPTPTLPKSYPLFVASGQGYFLSFNKEIKGKISIGGTVEELEALAQRKETKKEKDTFLFPLTEEMRGKVAVADVSILFQFVPPQPVAAAGILETDFYLSWQQRVDWVMLGILLGSALFHFGFVFYTRSLPPPPEPTYQDIEDRFVRILSPEKPKEPPAEVKGDEPAKVEEKQEDKSEKQDKQEKSDKPPPTEAERKQAIKESVKTKGMLALLGAKGTRPTGTGISDIMDNTSGNLDKFLSSDASLDKAGQPGGLKGQDFGHAPVGDVTGPDIGTEEVKTAKRENKSPKSSIDKVQDLPANLDGAAIAATLGKYRGAIDTCYTKEINANPNISGRLRIAITIESSGKVIETRPVENTTGSEGLEKCLIGRMKYWKFPPFQEGDPVEFTVPLIFSGSNG